MNDTLLSGVILLVILGIAALLLRIMWRQHKRDSATIEQLRAENADATAYLKKLGAAIDADGELLSHIQGDRMVARVLATEALQVLEREPWIAGVLKRNDDYLGRVLAAVAEDQEATIAAIRTAVDSEWTAEATYAPLKQYLAHANV
jgi:hypothetical protein